MKMVGWWAGAKVGNLWGKTLLTIATIGKSFINVQLPGFKTLPTNSWTKKNIATIGKSFKTIEALPTQISLGDCLNSWIIPRIRDDPWDVFLPTWASYLVNGLYPQLFTYIYIYNRGHSMCVYIYILYTHMECPLL